MPSSPVLRLALAVAVCVLSATAQAAVDPSGTTVLPAVVSPAKIPAGAPFKITYNWQATQAMSEPYTVFVHYHDATGKRVGQGDHSPRFPTNAQEWRGTFNYTVSAGLPADLADGTYDVIIGLYKGNTRAELAAGPGVKALDENRYLVGQVTVDHTAPWPKAMSEGEKTLDLKDYEVTWAEEFDAPLDVSPWGKAADGHQTKWIAHTPWNGDFGDARFMDPQPGFPFTVDQGILRIEARKDPAFKETDTWKREWAAGLIASCDAKGVGFGQQYGYFEMSAKLPTDPGVWPAFWLGTQKDQTDKSDTAATVEIDIIEFYGINPNAYQSAIHVWGPGKAHNGYGNQNTTKPKEAGDGFHRYGCMVDPKEITMYFDGVEMWRSPTPKEHTRPLLVMVNLALGSGWPIDKTPSPTVMDVDYVRVYGRKGEKSTSDAKPAEATK